MAKRNGFTLIELVVVVMILGILAAVAAPKLLNTSATATDNGVRQTLSVVRDAIERYAAENGGKLPGADQDPDTFKADLAKYLRGPFPECPVGDAATPDGLKMVAGSNIFADPAPTEGWKYSYDKGEFIINEGNGRSSDPALAYDD